MNENNFDLFIDKLQTIEFKLLGQNLDLSHYNAKSSNYKAELIKLQQTAITEILRNPREIDLQLKRLQQINERFSRFWDWYFEQQNQTDINDFLRELEDFFIIPKYTEKPLSRGLYYNLHDAAMLKQGVLKGFIYQVEKILPGTLKKLQTGFQTTLPPDKFTPLFTRLIEKGYIAPDTDLKNFTACFNGLPLPDTFARVQWIKRQKRGKNSLAKKALTDLLFLMGTPQEQTRDKTKLETCFCDPTGNPLKFTQSNFYNSKDSKDNSEYYQELKTIIAAF